ncbi:acyl-CoA dehydrogenase family protein [Mangrovivirga cuniculi]|uniref:Acyl-CoA dehydrogenase n=1 Tax=Mangrovivirga cuniculi TaxID=2715131 RepID=A0A4D7JQ98_9BACT|nr:acyl-CoA dehydrogenase family protein [Mangrovivirga cuniculi]QCK15650.1 acyl-CoA dehydrogenase [Mangrovivirga cuniculi]
MSLPDRNNQYSFDEYLQWRDKFNYYTDDHFLQKVLKHFAGTDWEDADKEARNISQKVSYRWRDLSERISKPEKRPFLTHYDAYHNRIDRIVRPHEVEEMEKEVYGEKLFSDDQSDWVRLIKMMLIYENGESCIACPVTCTEGLVELLNKFADSPETKRILQHCKEGIDGELGIGAQYISEKQGGSDIPANKVEAVKEDGQWKLYGSKFFCSATHADYVVVTAKPRGEEKVAVFVMPSWLPGDKEKEKRNGFTIDRIKDKMGTRELTTCEITLDGAVAYPVGPMDRGLANVVEIVLTYSRLTVGLSSAAYMVRAVREAVKYSEFREAFGMPVSEFPLVKAQTRKLEHFAKRTTAGAFKLYNEFLEIKEKSNSGKQLSIEDKKKKFRTRELIMLQKITGTQDCTNVIREAMSFFGGHGVMEDFSALPRLFRDSVINELWEGPRNVLLTQIFNDLKRAQEWYPASEFINDLLQHSPDKIKNEFSRKIESFMTVSSLISNDESIVETAANWDKFCEDLFHQYQDLALKEVNK